MAGLPPLSPERFDLAEALFHELLGLDPSEREARLTERTPADAAVREMVSRLLAIGEPAPLPVDDWLQELGLGDHLPADIGGYEVLDVLGEGGMGIVYRARQPRVDREVAIKVPSARTDGEDESLAEARAASRRNHPNVAILYEVVEHDGRTCPVMEYLPGGTLRDRLRAQPVAEPLAFDEVMRITRGILEGLAAVHAAGLVHGDLKPENIGFDADGQPKIFDFGIARERAPDVAPSAQHRTLLAGTPAYMSPERQAGGGRSVAADLWAVGIMLHEMVEAARRPAEGGGPSVRRRARGGAGRARARLERLLPRLLAFRPEDRPAGARPALALLRGAPSPRAAVRVLLAVAVFAVVFAAALRMPAFGARDLASKAARWTGLSSAPTAFRTDFETPLSLEDPGPFHLAYPDSSVWPEQEPGFLTLTTNFGDIQFDPTHCPNDRPPRNLLWVPIETGDRLAVSVVIDSFWPRHEYQQAGIVVAADETFREFVSFKAIAQDGLHAIQAIHQVRDEPHFTNVTLQNAHAVPFPQVTLRIIRDGVAWRCEMRRGMEAGWATVSTDETWSFDFEPRVAGIFAMNGFACEGEWPNRLPKYVPPVNVRFSRFVVEPYPPAS